MIKAIRNINSKDYDFNLKITVLILLMVFVFGGFFGFLYEELFYRIDLGYFTKRGTTFGPWIPIYGFGAVLIVLATKKLKRHPIAVFFAAALVSGILEFTTGYVLFHAFDELRLWDYNVEIWNWLNIGGYICLRSVVFFGLSALFLLYFVHPLFSLFADRCKEKHLVWIASVPAALFLGDILISLLCSALGRK